MPRTYKRSPGARTYADYSVEALNQAVDDIRSRRRTQRQASEHYKIPRATIIRKLKGTYTNPAGGQTVLDTVTEHTLAEYIKTCSTIGFPLDSFDVRCLVKAYLDGQGINVTKFTNNLPGQDWFKGYMQRHPDLTERLASYIKKLRAKVSPATINEYNDMLGAEIKDIPPENIYNYDETNLTDEPGQKKVITKRGVKYPERIFNSSKTSTSIMICASAAGLLLPPYVVYKAKEMWTSWTQGGPSVCRYNRPKSSWFDTRSFDDWFMTLVLPKLKQQTGIKVLIGDNLSSHLNTSIKDVCQANNIKFICLPANSTHLTQPLDVAFFCPMKRAWRKILLDFKLNSNCTTIPKNEFPNLLKILMCELQQTTSTTIRNGFKKMGIYPLDRNSNLSRLPTLESERAKEGEEIEVRLSETVLNFLEKKRYGEENPEKIRRKKVNVPPGKSVTAEDFESADNGGPCTSKTPKPKPLKTSTPRMKKTKKVIVSDEETDSSNMSIYSEYEEESFSDLDLEADKLPVKPKVTNKKAKPESNKVSIVETKQHTGTSAEEPKHNQIIKKIGKYNVQSYVIFECEGEFFLGVIEEVVLNKYKISAMSMRGPSHWKWPNNPDICWYTKEDIKGTIAPPVLISARGTFSVPEIQKWRLKDKENP